MRTTSSAFAMLLALGGCSEDGKEEARLLGEARAAAVARIDDQVSARFDFADLVVFPEQGLVCGGKLKAKDDRGEYGEYEPFYYARGRGVALTTHNSALYDVLARECASATRAMSQTE